MHESTRPDRAQGLAMGIFASSDPTRRWMCLVRSAQVSQRSKWCDRATKVTGASVPDDSASFRTGCCREKEHEGSMMAAAKEEQLHNGRLQQTQDRGRGGTEASKLSSRASKASDLRDSTDLEDPGRSPQGSPRSIQTMAEFSMHAWLATAQQCKRKTQPM